VLRLHTFHLTTNQMTLRSAPTLSKAVAYQLSSLIDLDLSDNSAVFSGEDGSGLKCLIDAICPVGGVDGCSCKLQRLNLSRNAIGRVGRAVRHIKRLLCSNSSLRYLVLAQNYLGQKHMDANGGLHNNSTLRVLDLSGNGLRDAGVHTLMKAINQRLEGCVSQLEEIDLSDNIISCKGAHYISTLLSNNFNTSLQKLNLSNNVIKPDGAEFLTLVMKYNHTLTELNLAGNSLCCDDTTGIDGVQYIAESLCQSDATNLLRLNLSWNSINNTGAIALANMLRNNAKLESLDISNNAIGNDGINALIDSLPYDVALKELLLHGNQISDEKKLVTYICHRSYKLERLTYEQNNFSLDQEENIVSAVRFQGNMKTWLGILLEKIGRKEIRSLKVLKKEFGDKELIAIAEHLVQYPVEIRAAFFCSNRVTDHGIRKFADNVLSNNNASKVQRLYCHGMQQLTHVGVAAVARSLTHTTSSLVGLTLSCCNVGPEAAESLANALESNTTLKMLSLESNRISDFGARVIFAAILDPPHKNLVTLNLASNFLTDDALQRLGSFSKLVDVRLDSNDISDSGALDLGKAVLGSSSIEYLNVSNNPRLSSKGIKALQLFLPNEFVLQTDLIT
jgi:NLR family CARD domain-containing protein 3